MFFKGLTLILFTTAVAVVLVHLRQERFEMMHEMVSLHQRMDQSRQAVWDWQVRIAQRSEPQSLHQAIDRSQLVLEPALPSHLGIRSALASAHPRHD